MIILDSIIEAIIGFGFDKLVRNTENKEHVLKVITKVGLEPLYSRRDFENIYAHTLVNYGIGKPKPLLEFFKHPFIQKAFEESFISRDPSILDYEAENFLDWSYLGKEFNNMDFDPRKEFARFTNVFFSISDRSRSVSEIRRDQSILDIKGGIKEIRNSIAIQIQYLNDFIESNNSELLTNLEEIINNFEYASSSEDINKLLNISIEISFFKLTKMHDITGIWELSEYSHLTNKMIKRLLSFACTLDQDDIIFFEIINSVFSLIRS